MENKTWYGGRTGVHLSPKEEFRLAAKTVAEGFEAQFPEAEIDGEYTETGYADLPKRVQATGTWAEFHAAVEKVLQRMRGSHEEVCTRPNCERRDYHLASECR